MHHLPLNRDRDPVAWTHFDPGLFVDLNPGFVRVCDDEAWVVFCRHPTPPRPGEGSIWAVRVDTALDPVGRPVLLLGHGFDPRAIMVGRRILLFYSIIDRDPDGLINGASMALAEFCTVEDQWQCRRNSLFPKHPIEGELPPGAQQNWEKNWIPFLYDGGLSALIYSHEPWNVITLDMYPESGPAFGTAFQLPGLQWEYGTICGGTPAVRFDDEHLVTFFHSSQVMGSRTVYSAGACVFLARPPFTPMLFTASPLLMAPYRSGVQRFDWNYAISVIFPAGVERVGETYRLLCGRDDGEIVTFSLDHAELQARLRPVTSGPVATVHDYRGGAGVRLPLQKLLYVPDPIPGIPELPMVNFLKALVGQGRTFVDVGAHIGFYSMGLAPRFERVVAFEPSRFQYGWLTRNRALNDYLHVQCEPVALGDKAMQTTLKVLSYEGGLNSVAPDVAYAHGIIDQYTVPVETLDSRGMIDVDLIKIDVEGFEIEVLRGASRTIDASRPVILIEVWDDPARRHAMRLVMEAMNYSLDFIFPASPELALCLPNDRRHQFAWFV